MEFIGNYLANITIFFPIFCILIMIAKWKKIEIRKAERLYMAIQISLMILALAAVPLIIPKVTAALEFYIIFFAIYAAMILHKTKELKLSRIFPLAGLMIFVAADLWELPMFVYGQLGIFHSSYQFSVGQWFDHIHRFYALGIFAVLLWLSKWKPNRWSLGILAASAISPFIILAATTPSFPFWVAMVRIIPISLFGCGIILGLEPTKAGC